MYVEWRRKELRMNSRLLGGNIRRYFGHVPFEGNKYSNRDLSRQLNIQVWRRREEKSGSNEYGDGL